MNAGNANQRRDLAQAIASGVDNAPTTSGGDASPCPMHRACDAAEGVPHFDPNLPAPERTVNGDYHCPSDNRTFVTAAAYDAHICLTPDEWSAYMRGDGTLRKLLADRGMA